MHHTCQIQMNIETTLFLSVLMISSLDRIQHRFVVFSLLALPSTFFHETMHFIVALITNGKPVAFSVLPRRKGNVYHLGHVITSNSTFYNTGLISLAPLLLIPLAWLLLRMLPDRNVLWQAATWSYVMASMIYGSLPSKEDWRNAWATPISTAAILLVILFSGYLLVSGTLDSKATTPKYAASVGPAKKRLQQ